MAAEWRVINRVPRIRLLGGEKNREFVLDRSKEEAYLAACPQPLKDVATLMLCTGLRLGEALNLKWRDVDHEPINGRKRGRLRIKEGKTKNARRAVSLNVKATELLKARATTCDLGPDSLVFPSGTDASKPYLNSSLAHMHGKVRATLGYGKEFVIHSLRHTFLTRLGQAGADAFSIMRAAGHSSVVVSQRYVHLEDHHVDLAFEKLDSLEDALAKKKAEKNSANTGS